MMTLGMPARISTANASGRESHPGRRSVRAKAAPREMGTARITAMAEVWRVPTMRGRIP
jgi:hypothetical protein